MVRVLFKDISIRESWMGHRVCNAPNLYIVGKFYLQLLAFIDNMLRENLALQFLSIMLKISISRENIVIYHLFFYNIVIIREFWRDHCPF